MSQSLFEKIGGAPAVDAAVDVFYRKVLSDDSISQFLVPCGHTEKVNNPLGQFVARLSTYHVSILIEFYDK